ncbi:hypothetical protein AB8U03_12220 [Clostridium sp. Mt-5]|uniref:Uncharacterized protein n=1 Tax=Clostridium moutaii TaxID=3240932 RepID=A0ABV4BQ85_9CLOT
MTDYRIQIQVDGETIETLQDILPQGSELNILFVGKVPTPFSVKEGHYFQGRQGKMFWNKLQKYTGSCNYPLSYKTLFYQNEYPHINCRS